MTMVVDTFVGQEGDPEKYFGNECNPSIFCTRPVDRSGFFTPFWKKLAEKSLENLNFQGYFVVILGQFIHIRATIVILFM